MDFLRRILRGRDTDPSRAGEAGTADTREAPESLGGTASAGNLDALERDRDVELLRADHERLDELQQRQLRYASYAWEPPRQGGERRAEDSDPPPS